MNFTNEQTMYPVPQPWPSPCPYFLGFLEERYERKKKGVIFQSSPKLSLLLPCAQMPNISEGSHMTLPRGWILFGRFASNWARHGHMTSSRPMRVNSCLLGCFQMDFLGRNKREPCKKKPFLTPSFFNVCCVIKGQWCLALGQPSATIAHKLEKKSYHKEAERQDGRTWVLDKSLSCDTYWVTVLLSDILGRL